MDCDNIRCFKLKRNFLSHGESKLSNKFLANNLTKRQKLKISCYSWLSPFVHSSYRIPACTSLQTHCTTVTTILWWQHHSASIQLTTYHTTYSTIHSTHPTCQNTLTTEAQTHLTRYLTPTKPIQTCPCTRPGRASTPRLLVTSPNASRRAYIAEGSFWRALSWALRPIYRLATTFLYRWALPIVDANKLNCSPCYVK